jgi:hypothetical protein
VNPKTQAGERLPYLLAKLKAPRVLERLDETAERARTEQWPYEQFLQALLEAEVFARMSRAVVASTASRSPRLAARVNRRMAVTASRPAAGSRAVPAPGGSAAVGPGGGLA